MTQTSQRQHRGPRLDGPWTALLVLPILALVVPSALLFAGPLESNGWPARLLTLWIAGAIVLGWVGRRRRTSRVSPAEAVSWLLMAASVSALAAGSMRLLPDPEAAGALRAALVMFPLLIVALGIATLADSRRINQLLAVIVVGAAVSAGLAIAQSVVPFDSAQLMQLPGMVARDIGGMGVRGSFVRVKGAAAHPIELGVICGSVLPIAVHFARFAASHRHRVYAAIAAFMLVLAIPMSVSRSGVLVAVISMAVYAVVLTARLRIQALLLGLVGIVLLRAAIPGLLGAVRGIFGGASTDPSITSRTEDYARLSAQINESLFFGQGLGTFRPEQYFFLDNQYLLGLVEGGAVFLVATIVFFLGVASSARGAVLRASSASAASRGQAVAGAVVSIAASGAFFDLFSFAQITVVLFVLAGVAGALWHDGVERGNPIPTPLERMTSTPAGVAA